MQYPLRVAKAALTLPVFGEVEPGRLLAVDNLFAEPVSVLTIDTNLNVVGSRGRTNASFFIRLAGT